MINLRLDRVPAVLAIGAHPDDIEIGCGGTLLRLADSYPGLAVSVVVMSGSDIRRAEALSSTQLFLPDAEVTTEIHDLPDGRLPQCWGRVKESLEEHASRRAFDLVLTPQAEDLHQDHRLLGRLAGTVWRDHLILGYEIPKWDGDFRQPNVYVPLPPDVARRKVALLNAAFPSQADNDWWDEEVFLGVARLRGMECHKRYAEAFYVRKVELGLS